jgi:hypothetical protein
LTSTSRIASDRVLLFHQVEQGRAVVQVHAWSHPALTEHGQFDGPPGVPVVSVQAAGARPRPRRSGSGQSGRNLLGLGE